MFLRFQDSTNGWLQTLPLYRGVTAVYALRRHVPQVPQKEQGRQGAPLLERRRTCVGIRRETLRKARVLYLGEISDAQRASWERRSGVFDEGTGETRQMTLFPERKRPRCSSRAGTG